MNQVAQYMMETSPKVKSLPKTLYHASYAKNHESIANNGIIRSEMFGQTYLCEEITQCMNFFSGQDMIVYEVDTKQLNKKYFRLSLDHNKIFFPYECYAYYRDIPVRAIRRHIHEIG